MIIHGMNEWWHLINKHSFCRVPILYSGGAFKCLVVYLLPDPAPTSQWKDEKREMDGKGGGELRHRGEKRAGV